MIPIKLFDFCNHLITTCDQDKSLAKSEIQESSVILNIGSSLDSNILEVKSCVTIIKTAGTPLPVKYISIGNICAQIPKIGSPSC